MQRKGILVTGVPGFIGKRLIERLLPQGRPVYMLCERRFADESRALAKKLDPTGEQVFVTPGDITQTDLALDAKDLERVRAEVDELYHLAAVYDLSVPEDVARTVNVVGTGKVVRFLKGFPEGSVRHNYISTCYVAGGRQGMIFENELDRGQSFKNHYESTKYAAEVLVERSKKDVETRIFRPSIVIGDSQTGETQKFDGPYPCFGAIMMGWMVAFPGPGRAPTNIVPVDFVIDALATIPQRPDTAGKTFALADPHPLSARALTELAADRLGAPRPRITVPMALFKPLFKVQKLVDLVGVTPETFAYFDCAQIYDTTNTNAALRGTDVACPRVPTYINQILRYYRDRAALPWRFDTPS